MRRLLHMRVHTKGNGTRALSKHTRYVEANRVIVYLAHAVIRGLQCPIEELNSFSVTRNVGYSFK